VAKTAYFDCFSGASGDMVLGALLDVGLPLDGLRAALGSLALEYGAIGAERVLRAGVSATRFRSSADPGPETATHQLRHDHTHTHVHTHVGAGGAVSEHSHTHHHPHGAAQEHDPGDDHGHRHGHEHGGPDAGHHHGGHGHHSLKDIAAAIGRSDLSAAGKARAVSLFERLGEAEAAIHAVPVERIHLHEVGALDSIIDIVGAVYGMEWLGVDEVLVSPLNVGSGTVECAHGTFPVPAPATARLLQGVPIYAGDVRAELVTPTGALLMTGYASRFGPLPVLRVDRIGYGAGARDFPRHPNVLRLMIGEAEAGVAASTVVAMECEIDDMNPQLFGPLMERLLAAGALDVYYTAVQMKKGRPGTLVTVLAPPSGREALAAVLFRETTTIGVRYQEMRRECLEREVRTIDTSLGPVRFKVASRDGRVLTATPEFDDCLAIATARGLAVRDVQGRLMREYQAPQTGA
jgi:pyridinium-3,5-bisthiocarboxylic acid mononucleotide nickel chelatase